MGHTRRYYKNKKRNKTKNKHIRFKQNRAIENKKQDLNFHKEFVLNLSKRDITETEFKVIAKADKNNTTVIQNKRDYLTEGESQLNDGIHYTKIINIDIENTRKIVNKLIYRMKENDEIDEMSFKFLREEGKTFKTPKAYFLPKIHKPSTETLEMYQNTCMNKGKVRVPGRPIISQCSGPESKMLGTRIKTVSYKSRQAAEKSHFCF
ncbi:unnamed protein product [Mytilus edulis]|uniref:Uncharacterized protein n=1 Tax=Mytilus edulis TaxID=6550 RepID=A0A8S3TGM4_MYTED|nr:unnamed protein product [Mytilus edulis]